MCRNVARAQLYELSLDTAYDIVLISNTLKNNQTFSAYCDVVFCCMQIGELSLDF